MLREWHRRMLEGVAVPSDAYRGGYRGDSHPHLKRTDVAVDGVAVVPSTQVGREIRNLITWLRNELPRLDRLEALVRTADDADVDNRQLALDYEVIDVAAHLHGEWVRIHPFVNGNGRTARMWILWATTRYGVPPLISLRPRPPAPYGDVSRASLARGDHSNMALFLRQIYASFAP